MSVRALDGDLTGLGQSIGCDDSVPHQEGLALDGDSNGRVQPSDEAGINRRSRSGVVLADSVYARYEEGVVLVGNRKSNGNVQPLDEFSLNQLARSGVVFAHAPPACVT